MSGRWASQPSERLMVNIYQIFESKKRPLRRRPGLGLRRPSTSSPVSNILSATPPSYLPVERVQSFLPHMEAWRTNNVDLIWCCLDNLKYEFISCESAVLSLLLRCGEIQWVVVCSFLFFSRQKLSVPPLVSRPPKISAWGDSEAAAAPTPVNTGPKRRGRIEQKENNRWQTKLNYWSQKSVKLRR